MMMSRTFPKHRPFRRERLPRRAESGNGLIMGAGLFIAASTLGVLAVDLPTYFAAQNQLQTAVESAALAGAQQLPYGESSARSSAVEVGITNPVMGKALTQANFTIPTVNTSNLNMTVRGQATAPSVFGQLLCGLTSAAQVTPNQGGGVEEPEAPPQGTENQCLGYPVFAGAKAVPAARDTILVIDNSSSMNDLGNNRPLVDVLSAARQYVDTVRGLGSQSVDRLGLVRFAYDATLLRGLRDTRQDPNFSDIKSKISGITIYNAQGWNTNYEAPLKVALDELQAKGRPNATKVILFMTDGKPNLPAPPSYYSYSQYQPYKRCTDMVHNDSNVKSKTCTWDSRNRRWINCAVLPDSRITTSLIPANAYNCATEYTNYLSGAVKTQADRAKSMNVTIHTIEITADTGMDNANSILQRMVKNPSWDPELLAYMTDTTTGQSYTAANFDASAIAGIYRTIAADIRMKLSN
jgi:Flp pilus assembly protein TadG